MKTKFLLAGFLCCFQLSAQNITDFTRAISQAQISIKAGRPDSSVYFYDKAFKSAVPEYVKYEYSEAAKVAAKLHHWRKSLKYLKKSYQHGVFYDDWSELDSLRTTVKWRRFEKKKERFKLEFFKSHSIDLYNDIAKLKGADQVARKVDLDSCGILNINQVDSVNFVGLKLLISEHGFENVYAASPNDILLLITHYLGDNQKWEAYLEPIIQKAFNDGVINPRNYAFLIDRSEILDGNLQVYGTQKRYDRENRKLVYEGIRNIDEVDKRRNTIGLVSLDDQSRRNGVELPEGYKK